MSRCSFWRPARPRRGRCAIAQLGAAKSVVLRRPTNAAGCALGKTDDRPTTRDAPGKRRAASATACCKYAWLEASKARSAKTASCVGRSGAACSAVLQGRQTECGGVGVRRPLEAIVARRRQPTVGRKRWKTERGETPSGGSMPRTTARPGHAGRRKEIMPRPGYVWVIFYFFSMILSLSFAV